LGGGGGATFHSHKLRPCLIGHLVRISGAEIGRLIRVVAEPVLKASLSQAREELPIQPFSVKFCASLMQNGIFACTSEDEEGDGVSYGVHR
jgi:hypothetical protein